MSLTSQASGGGSRVLVLAAGVVGAAGVGLSAAAAHRGGAFTGTAANFLLMHAPVFLAIGLAGGNRCLRIASLVLFAGLLLFCGDLLARDFAAVPDVGADRRHPFDRRLGGDRRLGAMAPSPLDHLQWLFSAGPPLALVRWQFASAAPLGLLGSGRDAPIVAIDVLKQMTNGMHGCFSFELNRSNVSTRKMAKAQPRLRSTRKRGARRQGLDLPRRFSLTAIEAMPQSLR